MRFDFPPCPGRDTCTSLSGAFDASNHSAIVQSPFGSTLCTPRRKHAGGCFHPTGGFLLQQSGRTDFHFVECSFNTRQRQYLRDSSGRKGVWNLADARIANQLGCHFRLFPIDVVVTTGNVGRIDKQCVMSVWGNGNTTIEMDGLSKPTPELIVQNSNNVYPTPVAEIGSFWTPPSCLSRVMEQPRMLRENTHARKALPPMEYRPKSPKPLELGAPEHERPESRYAADGPIGKLPDTPSRAHKQLRVEGFTPRPLSASPDPVQERSHQSKQPSPKMQHTTHPFDLPTLTRPVPLPLVPKLPLSAKVPPLERFKG